MGKTTQAVLNLVRNAWQACGEDGELAQNPRSQFTVGSNVQAGLRVAGDRQQARRIEELLPRLFLPMVTGNAKGNRLGLSIAQRIANQHGGLIQVQVSRATPASLLLPMESEMPVNEQVWIVDDDSSIRWVMEKALTRAGMDCRAFESGFRGHRCPRVRRALGHRERRSYAGYGWHCALPYQSATAQPARHHHDSL